MFKDIYVKSLLMKVWSLVTLQQIWVHGLKIIAILTLVTTKWDIDECSCQRVGRCDYVNNW